MLRKRLMNVALSLALCGSMLIGGSLPAQAVVRDNVGGMDTSVDTSGNHSKGAAKQENILKGYAAWVNGELIEGTMNDYSGSNKKTYSITGKTIDSYGKITKTIEKGYHDGSTASIAATNLVTSKSITEITEDGVQKAQITLNTGSDNTYAVNDSVVKVPIEMLKNNVGSLNSSISYLEIINQGSSGSYTYYRINAYNSAKQLISSTSCQGNNAHWYIDINEASISSDSGWSAR